MSMKKTIKGIAMGTSLAAFVTLGVPATSSASNLLGIDAEQSADKKKEDPKKKKDDKKKEGEKGEKGEGACGEGACGEGGCGGKDKEEKK